jgi:hypothetical protein
MIAFLRRLFAKDYTTAEWIIALDKVLKQFPPVKLKKR